MSAGQSIGSAGTSGSACQVSRNTDSPRSPGRWRQISSAVNDRIGASQRTMALGDVPQRGLRRAARVTGRRRRVEPILEHIEIQAAQIHDAEVVHLLIDQVEGILAVGLDDLLLQLRACAATAQRSSATICAGCTDACAGSKPCRLPSRKRTVLRMRR